MHNRFYIEEKIDSYYLGKKIALESIAGHVKAFRKQTGAEIMLYDGTGAVFSAKIIDISKRNVNVELLSVKKYPESNIKIYLFLPMVTSHIMDQLISRVCELEISGIVPVVTERSIALKSEKEIISKMSKWDKISKGAMIIAGKNFSTVIRKPVDLPAAFKSVENFDAKLIAVPQANLFLKKYLESFHFKKDGVSIGIFIGPEGDFSYREVALSKEYGFIPVKLTAHIMSTFVASIYSASNLICYAFSD